MSEEEAPQVPARVCASCGYDLSGVASGTCPECGYTPTPEEIALAERRAVFVELTRIRQWGTYAWQVGPFVFLTVLAVRRGPLEVLALFVALTGAAVIWAEVSGRMFVKAPRGQLNAARTVWRLSSKWLVMPIWATGVFVATALIFEPVYSYYDPYPKYLVPVADVTALAGYLGAWTAWRWSWRRLARAGGLTTEARDIRNAAPAAKRMMWPIGILLALPLLALVIEFLLDTLRPEWWR
jgi:hypothetical protein